MTTIIRSNGSHCLGSGPDTIETLLEILAQHPLRREFEQFGDFYQPVPHLCDQFGAHNHTSELEGLANFFGNFLGLTHVFDVYTDDAELIEKLRAAIQANKSRSDYLSQPEPKPSKHDKKCHCVSCRYEEYRKVCPVCRERESA